MKDDLKERIQTIQASMVESARPGFSESQLDHLRVLIRLTMEFYDFLQYGNPGLREITERHQRGAGGHIPIDTHEQELTYTSESIFWAIDSFCSVSAVYGVLTGSLKSGIEWDKIRRSSLKELFVSMFHDFEIEADFVKKCRLLLDLFKIQIVFAGVSYD